MSKNKPVLNYDFKCINFSQCTLEYDLKVEGSLMVKTFFKAKQRLARTKGIKVEGDLDKIDGFDLLPQYFKILEVGLRKKTRNVIEEVKQDGIKVIDLKLTKGKYKRDKENPKEWRISLLYEGNYVK